MRPSAASRFVSRSHLGRSATLRSPGRADSSACSLGISDFECFVPRARPFY